MKRSLLNSFLIILVLALMGCSTPPVPPEVERAKAQELSLWREGAKVHIPLEYAEYLARLGKAREDFTKQSDRLPILINYKDVTAQFANVIADGDVMLGKIKNLKSIRASQLSARISHLQDSMGRVDELSSLLNEKRLSSRNLTKAEILLNEARTYTDKEYFEKADKALGEAELCIDFAKKSVVPLLSRYVDGAQIRKWKNFAAETVAASAAKGSFAIIISKLDRKLTLYKAGKPIKTYHVGLGRNGFSDKLHAGDNATPEGRYYITKKIPRSKYYKALLINYPNEEDRARFAAARRKGSIPRTVGIGGLVEIHGGGKDSMTYGCVALENPHMEELFNLVDAGTPVTIIGVTDMDESLSSRMDGI